ncbi:L-lactate permease [Aerococcaceae bacterium 50-4]
MDHNIPITITNWLFAILPIATLFIMLIFLNTSAPLAGAITLAISIVVGMYIFEMPMDTTMVGLSKGAWDALFILIVVWTALLLYQVIRNSGAFKAIRNGVQKISQNYLFLSLAFGWVFASFLQGVAGFGAPIAIVAPLLIGIGLKPVYAVVLPLIATNWAKFLGSLGTGWLATTNLVNIENESMTLLFSGIMLWIADLTGGLIIAWLFGRMKAIKEGLPAILLISLIHGGGQILVSQFNPVLATFIPSILAMGAVILLTRWKRYSEPSDLQENSPIIENIGGEDDLDEEEDEANVADLSLNDALMPYYVLTVLSVIGLGIPAISDFLGQFELGFAFPEVSTGMDYVVEAEELYSPLTIFTHPGFYLFISSVFAYFWFKSKNAYENNDDLIKSIFSGLYDDAKDSTLSILAFLMMSQVLEHSGQNATLAMGIAAVAPPALYAFLSVWIGIIGAFMTSSSTSANILFSPLHQSVVGTMGGLSFNLVIAGHSAGGAIGNAIAPANIVIGASTASVEDEEQSKILRIGMIYTLIAGGLSSLIAVAIHLFIGG